MFEFVGAFFPPPTSSTVGAPITHLPTIVVAPGEVVSCVAFRDDSRLLAAVDPSAAVDGDSVAVLTSALALLIALVRKRAHWTAVVTYSLLDERIRDRGTQAMVASISERTEKEVLPGVLDQYQSSWRVGSGERKSGRARQV